MSQDELTLYILVGESLCMIQHLKDALSHSIVLKKEVKRPHDISKQVADRLIDKYRFYTLGKAIKIVKEEELFSEQLQKELERLLVERNWLVHRSIAHDRDEWDLNISRGKLFERTKHITRQSQTLLIQIEEDLMKFSESNGVDMSRVRDEISKHRRKTN
ncbi:hypothetical protein [Mangrovibacterium marinum]|uniref:hypothetical protein n=1 Tax=Mangrovibacterium marinum TaxID=1639118 RepID=UPI002A1871D4|nr:hypothetical protein [Mangrovibacterium marinum]